MKSLNIVSFTQVRDIIFLLGLLLPLTATAAINTDTPAPAIPAISEPMISKQQAIGLALNTIEAGKQSITVSNRQHRAVFDQNGVQFTPTRGPDWHWQLTHINSELQAPVVPTHGKANSVDFIRTGLTERYLIKAKTIEQRFVLDKPGPKWRNLVIRGAIQSKANMTATDRGWVWRDSSGVVTVFDATGKVLPALMRVTDKQSTITLAAADLAAASYPVTVDPEIGTNDFRLSDMGADGDGDLDAMNPAVAFNAIANEYLVVWSGDDNTGTLVNGENEIFAQLFSAITVVGGGSGGGGDGGGGSLDMISLLLALSLWLRRRWIR